MELKALRYLTATEMQTLADTGSVTVAGETINYTDEELHAVPAPQSYLHDITVNVNEDTLKYGLEGVFHLITDSPDAVTTWAELATLLKENVNHIQYTGTGTLGPSDLRPLSGVRFKVVSGNLIVGADVLYDANSSEISAQWTSEQILASDTVYGTITDSVSIL